MAFLKVDKEKTIADKSGGINVIRKSGIYDMTIKAASVNVTKGGATQMDFNLEGEDGSCTAYGLTLFNKDGSENFGLNMLSALCTTLGIEELSDPEPEEFTFGEKVVTLNTIPELKDVDVKVRLQMEYSRYNDKVRGAIKVRRFYRVSDGATGSEIAEEVEEFKQLGKDIPYADKDSLKDGVTPEEAAICLAELSAPKGGSGANPAAAETKKTVANPFAKKPAAE